MKWKITARYYLIPIKTATLKQNKKEITKLLRCGGSGTFVRTNDADTTKYSMKAPQKKNSSYD